MKNKKFLPLVILVGVVALLGILLAVLTLHGEAETDTTLPLCDLAVDDILLKGLLHQHVAAVFFVP